MYKHADTLSDVLRSLRATGTVYFCDQLEAPWSKDYLGDPVASFHQVRRGGCWFSSDGVKEYLGPGDLVFIEPGRAHSLSDQISDHPEGQTHSTLLLCGYCEFSGSIVAPLASLFPKVCVIRDEQMQAHSWLRKIQDTLISEYISNQPGTRLVVQKLTEVLLVELIRMNFGQQEKPPLLRALSDNQMAKALGLLHQTPENNWSLDSVAAEVGMSRASFAKRFKDLVEHTMYDYLTQIRLQRACELLTDTQLSLYDIANRSGYDSDLAFTRTFKKRIGVTPTAYRKAAIQNG